MKKGTIYKNLWAGHETYFSYQRQSTMNGNKTMWGYIITNIDGKWKLRTGHYYLSDIQNDREHFPEVGNVNIDKLITNAILGEVDIS